MSYYESGTVEAYRPPAVPQAAGVAYVSCGKRTMEPEEMLVGDVIGLCVLPADCVPIDFALVPDDLDTGTNLKLSAGVYDKDTGDLDSETIMIDESTVGQTGGAALMESVVIADAKPSDRIIAARIDAAGVAAEASTGTITIGTGNVTANDDITIGDKTYTFVSGTPSTEGDVLVGTSAEDTADNLFAAINRTDPESNDGVIYSVAAAHPSVVAVDIEESSGDYIITVEAAEAGAAGNSIALAKNGTNITVSGETLSGGVDAVPLQRGIIRGVLVYRAAEYDEGA